MSRPIEFEIHHCEPVICRFDGLIFLRKTTEDHHTLGRHEIVEESGEEKTYQFDYYITVNPNNTFCRHAFGLSNRRRRRQIGREYIHQCFVNTAHQRWVMFSVK